MKIRGGYKRKPFNSDDVYYWFGDSQICAWCGKPHADCAHHIVIDDDNSDSLLNCAPLNNEYCHLQIHSVLKKKVNVNKLLQYTFEYLLSRGYKLTNKDIDFIRNHEVIYKNMMKKNV